MGKLNEMKSEVDGFLKYKHVDWNGVSGDAILEGKTDGFSWAFIESHWHKSEICYRHSKHRMLFFVDISCFSEVLRHHSGFIGSHCFDITLPKMSLVDSFGTRRVSLHAPSFRNQSPSKWDNGYGICEYLCYELESYDSSSKRLNSMIEAPFETLFGASEEKLREVANDIMQQLKPFFIWCFSFGVVTKPGFDKFDYVVKTDASVLFNTLKKIALKENEPNEKMIA